MVWPLVATPTTARIGSTSLYSHAVILHDCSDARASSTCTYVQTLPAGQGTLGTGNYLATRARPTLEGVAVLAGIPDDGATDTSEFVVGSVHVFACVQNASAPAGWACRPTQLLTAPEEIAGTGVRPLALGLQLAGPRVYGDEWVDDAFMGDGRRAATAGDIRRALGIYRSACAVLWLVVVGLCLILRW